MVRGLAIFFDIGDTLASPVLVGRRLAGLSVYPFVPDVLSRMRAAGGVQVPVALGLISNTGNEAAETMTEVLARSGLLALVDSGLCLFSSVEGLDKSQPAFFERARDRAALPAGNCRFVGEDAGERAVAASVGFLVSPHPLHALHLVEIDIGTDSVLGKTGGMHDAHRARHQQRPKRDLVPRLRRVLIRCSRETAGRARGPSRLRPEGSARERPRSGDRRASIPEPGAGQPAVPSLTAPVANGTTSEFKTIGTETVPLTGTRTVKFRQTLHDIPVYGSLVTVELGRTTAWSASTPRWASPKASTRSPTVSPAEAMEAAAAAPDGYTPTWTGVVPRLQLLLRPCGLAWRLVYILEDVPVTLDRSRPAAGSGQRDSSRPGSSTTWSTPTTGGRGACCPARRAWPADGADRVDSFGVDTHLPRHGRGRAPRPRGPGPQRRDLRLRLRRPRRRRRAGCPVTPSPTHRPGHPPRSAPTPTRWRCRTSCAPC